MACWTGARLRGSIALLCIYMQARLAIVDVETTEPIQPPTALPKSLCCRPRAGLLPGNGALVNPGTPIPGVIQGAYRHHAGHVGDRAPLCPDRPPALKSALPGACSPPITHASTTASCGGSSSAPASGIKRRRFALCKALAPAVPRRCRCRPRHVDRAPWAWSVRRAIGARFPDAAVLWQFLRIAAEEHGDDVVEVAARQIARQLTLPPQLDPSPTRIRRSGVYLFDGEGAAPLYIGKSRARCWRCAALHRQGELDAVAGGGPNGSTPRASFRRLLREAQLVKALTRPTTAGCGAPSGCVIFAFDGKRLRLAAEDEIDAETLPRVWGMALMPRGDPGLARNGRRASPLSASPGGLTVVMHVGLVFVIRSGTARVFARAKRASTPTARLRRRASADKGPRTGRTADRSAVEADESRDATEGVHVPHRWCYQYSDWEAEVADLLEARRPRFDYDHYRILSRHLGKRGVRVVPLAALMHCELVVPGLLCGRQHEPLGRRSSPCSREAVATRERRSRWRGGCRRPSKSAKASIRPGR